MNISDQPACVLALLKTVEFINVATASGDGQPNAAPKFLLKCEGNSLYAVDYVMATTWENLKNNPQVSIPVMDSETLIGYRINGKAEIIPQGALRNHLLQELSQKQIRLSTQRIIAGVKKEKKYESFELAFPEEVGIFKIVIEEITEIGPAGQLKRVGTTAGSRDVPERK
jgi:uncharacterized pyridoxamine 5'-phosphate oxidase family protein